MKTLLVTTKDKTIWSKNDRIILLGKWCDDINLYLEWKNTDYQVAEYFYPDQETKSSLVQDSKMIYSNLMDALHEQLNKFHATTHSRRYWEILLGPFLVRYIRVVMNRYLTLEKCLKNYKCEYTVEISHCQSITPKDTLNFLNLVDNDLWNNSIYSMLIKDYFKDIQVIRLDENGNENSIHTDAVGLESGSFFSKATFLFTYIFYRIVNKKNKTIYYQVQLPRKFKLLLHLFNGQYPLNSGYSSFFLKKKEVEGGLKYEERDSLTFEGSIKNNYAGYHDALEKYLNLLIPSIFMEHYNLLTESVLDSGLPRNPKAIITSTAFDVDEIFKAWTASCVERESKYIVLQHGATYGVNPYFSDTVEELTSDAFFTWGWRKTNKHIPGFCFNTIGNNVQLHAEGGLLIVEMILRRKKFIWDVYGDYEVYMNNQHSFLKALPADIRKVTTVRLHLASKRSLGNEYDFFITNFPELHLCFSDSDFWEQLRSQRLVVFSYDSTGLLELLNLDFPVVAFWDCNGFDRHDDDGETIYSELFAVGILHYSPQSAATFIQSIWGDVEKWWHSDAVDLVKKKMCTLYAAREKKPLRTFRNMVNSVAEIKG